MQPPVLFLVFLFAFVHILPVHAQDLTTLQEQLAAKQEAYRVQDASLREARQKVTHLTGEVRVAQNTVAHATHLMEQAWEQLSSKFQLIRMHPTISIAEEQRIYGDAKQKAKEREQALAILQDQLTQAERDAGTAETILHDMGRDRDAVERVLNETRFNALRPQLEREQIVEVRGEAGCGKNESLVACQQHALERALQQASEQGSALLLSSATTVKNFELTNDEIRTQVQALVLHHDVLKEGFVGKSGYFYEIRAIVKGQISAELKRQFLGDAVVATDAPQPTTAATNVATRSGQSTEQKLYKLTIHPVPADSTIKIMNITPKYEPGIKLAPGQYEVLVQRPGYRTVRQWVAIVQADVAIDIQLSRQTHRPADTVFKPLEDLKRIFQR